MLEQPAAVATAGPAPRDTCASGSRDPEPQSPASERTSSSSPSSPRSHGGSQPVASTTSSATIVRIHLAAAMIHAPEARATLSSSTGCPMPHATSPNTHSLASSQSRPSASNTSAWGRMWNASSAPATARPTARRKAAPGSARGACSRGSISPGGTYRNSQRPTACRPRKLEQTYTSAACVSETVSDRVVCQT